VEEEWTDAGSEQMLAIWLQYLWVDLVNDSSSLNDVVSVDMHQGLCDMFDALDDPDV
jgi:hypothetical protein